ncbi:uncharacterized protein LOC130644802 isoform X1 [Hydractinia symbiolongicarpus]|uniref:uncharacterized protein LOC130644802 isoform X1 n=1 Tax=Hydractinia symbiolongicarpus TaxID=13093 RepID=UPI00254BA9E9|nr:uncharacterized protein LOC130644802 isoform X1 [Hydractinia symbiolongicarpus]XP_057306521.1 uncharacterized protein LOC130644802 isoform X1 [Hydractinia symbiolongicarpus]
MAESLRNAFNTGEDAISYRRSLEQRMQKNVLKETVQNLSLTRLSLTENMISQPQSLANDLIELLDRVKIPLSVSFLNVSYSGWGKKDMITQRFLADHQDKFSLVVLGSDLKVQLRSRSIEARCTESSNEVFQLIQLFEKDINKLKMLRNSFHSQNITEVSYDTFITKYSTNKHKMNLSFILRNSHSLELVVQDRGTYVRFLKDNTMNVMMTEKEVWNILILEGLDGFLVACLKSLLAKFFIPINQGTLQSCFNFGPPIDKLFLQQHNDVFQGAGEAGVTLKSNKVNYTTTIINNSTPSKKNVVQNKETVNREVFTVEDVAKSSGEKTFLKCPENKENENVQKSEKDETLETVRQAIDKNHSVVLLGDGQLTPLFVDINKMDAKKRLRVLLCIRDAIDNELCKRE